MFGDFRTIFLFSSVQSFSLVWLFVTPWTTACQAFLSITNSRSSLKLISIELVMPSKHPILCLPLLLLPSVFPSIKVYSKESALQSGGRSTGASASPSMDSQGWFPLRLTGLISLLPKGLSRVFSQRIAILNLNVKDLKQINFQKSSILIKCNTKIFHSQFVSPWKKITK